MILAHLAGSFGKTVARLLRKESVITVSVQAIGRGFVTFMGVSERIAAKDMIQINKKRGKCNSQDYEGGICGVTS